ncbi:MAG: hypothetical protein ACOY93_12795 [Bacillota bacterium]
MKQIIVLQVANLLAFVGTVVVNALANALPINGRNTGEISDLYPNLFVPWGATFSIWGVIYLLLLCFALYQARPTRGSVDVPPAEKVGWWFVVSCVANVGWILAWHYEMVALSLVIMLVILASLLTIYFRLGVGTKAVAKAEKYFVHVPFSVYLGWITVATIANVTALLVKLQWNRLGLSEVFWTVAVILIATGISLAMLWRHSDFSFAAVVVWAFLGIIMKRVTTDPVPLWPVLATLGVSIVLIGFYGVSRVRKSLSLR